MIEQELLKRINQNHDKEAVIIGDETYLYEEILIQNKEWKRFIADFIPLRSPVLVQADFSAEVIAILLGLMQRHCIIGLINRRDDWQKYADIIKPRALFWLNKYSRLCFKLFTSRNRPLLYKKIPPQSSGLVLFSSGTEGKPKAVLHNTDLLLAKFKRAGRSLRTIGFLDADHIGGVNTLFYTLFNGGCLIVPERRSVPAVLSAIYRHKAQLLPVTPTFLGLMLLSGQVQRYSLSSLEKITYGTEPMPEYLLKRASAEYPQVKFQQTYGLSELGILRSKSKANNSTWVKIGGDGYKYKVIKGMLHIKAKSAMVGYLNAAQPFKRGWYNTGDLVERKGKYMRFLGRESEVINVGGDKVFPAEVEAVIQEVPEVLEARVYGVDNALMGQVVEAQVRIKKAEQGIEQKILKYCLEHLDRAVKVPVKVTITQKKLHTERFKKCSVCVG